MTDFPNRVLRAKSPSCATRRSHPCVNCSTTDRRCSFISQQPFFPRPHVTSESISSPSPASTASVGSDASSPASLGAVIRSTFPGSATSITDVSGVAESTVSLAGSPTENGLSSHGYDLFHLKLLHNFETQLLNDDNTGFFPDSLEKASLLKVFFDAAVSEPFLMDELLAVSALHMSTLVSDAAEKQHYCHQAALLQTRALTVFNSTPSSADKNSVSMFLFSSMLALHTLFDSTSYRQDLNQFLDRFIQFLDLQRGVRTVMRESWPIISQTNLKQIVQRMADAVPSDPDAETECDYLLDLLLTSGESLGSAALQTCTEAVRTIQWIIRQRRSVEKSLQTHAVMSWPILISSEFLKMLKQRRPEALVILAHWAVFLHLDRAFWVFGDSGRILIESTRRHLGSYWDDWLTWPQQILEE